MALDLDQLAATAQEYRANTDPVITTRCEEAMRQGLAQLREHLPAFNDFDLAAVAYYLAGLCKGLMDVPLRDADRILTDTALGYTLGAVKLMGMID